MFSIAFDAPFCNRLLSLIGTLLATLRSAATRHIIKMFYFPFDGGVKDYRLFTVLGGAFGLSTTIAGLICLLK